MSGIETTLNGHSAVIRVSGAIDGDMAERLKTAFTELPQKSDS